MTGVPSYRPQTKFAKVMFLQVSVCPQWGSTWASTSQAGTPGQVHPLGRYTPGRYTPWQVHPLGRYIPRQVHPPRPQCMLWYGQQAGGTHPTGMHSCNIVTSGYKCCWFLLLFHFAFVHFKQNLLILTRNVCPLIPSWYLRYFRRHRWKIVANHHLKVIQPITCTWIQMS